jgi:hypothetical protein
MRVFVNKAFSILNKLIVKVSVDFQPGETNSKIIQPATFQNPVASQNGIGVYITPSLIRRNQPFPIGVLFHRFHNTVSFPDKQAHPLR